MTFIWAAILLLLFSGQGFRFTFCWEQDGREHFVNEWSVEIEGGRNHAEEVASQHGYRVEREVSQFSPSLVYF